MTVSRERGRTFGARALRLLPALCLALMLALVSGVAMAGTCPASRVVERTIASLDAAARNGSPRAYTVALSHHANMTGLALFALGPYRRAVTSSMRGEYVRLTAKFVGHVVAKYREHLMHNRLVIEGCFRQNGAMLVRSRLGSMHLTWRVSGRRISDVKVEGIWLAIKLRSKFVAILRHHDGDVGALIRYLRES